MDGHADQRLVDQNWQDISIHRIYSDSYIYIYTVVLCMLLDPGYDCLLLYLHAFCTSYRSS